MEQDRAFLEAIRDDLGDDLHRLAWADWLEEHGQAERAAFVRAQLRLERLPEGDPERDALEDEADDLLEGHDAAWAGRPGELALEWTWSRGCVERVTLWADTLLRHGEELFAAAPLRELRLLTESGDSARLAGCELLSHVEALDLGHTSAISHLRGAFHRDRSLQQLFVSPHLKRLKRVYLRGNGIEGPLIQTLIDARLFGRLHELDLSHNPPLGTGAARLLAAERSNTLSMLDVWGTNVTAHGLPHLLRARSWPALRRLRVNARSLFAHGFNADRFEHEWAGTPLGQQLTDLHLDGVPLDGEAVAALLAWPGLSQIEELRLSGCQLTAEAGEALGRCAGLANLTHLDLTNNRLQDAGVRALAGSPHLTKLNTLKLDGNQIGGPGIRALAASPSLANLQRLSLSNNYVGQAGAEALAQGPPRRLRALWLSDANLDATAARLLAGAEALGRLRLLSVASNPLEDRGIQALAGSANLRRLREVHLDSCGMSNAGAKALSESPYLNHVKWLGLRNTYVPSREAEQLRVRFGSGAQF